MICYDPSGLWPPCALTRNSAGSSSFGQKLMLRLLNRQFDKHLLEAQRSLSRLLTPAIYIAGYVLSDLRWHSLADCS